MAEKGRELARLGQRDPRAANRVKRTGQSFGFSLALPNISGLAALPITVSVGVAAMRQVASRGEKPNVRRKYLSPDEARRVIDASARVGRLGERDKLLLTLIYRHGLRVSEAVDLRWTDFDLDAPKARPFHVRRLKGSKDAVHTLEPDTARLLKRMKADADGLYVFRSERGGPMSVDAVQVICNRAGREAGLRFKVHPHMHAPCVRVLPRRRGHGHPVDPGLPRAQRRQEHGDLH